jgi:hypothetical protein
MFAWPQMAMVEARALKVLLTNFKDTVLPRNGIYLRVIEKKCDNKAIKNLRAFRDVRSYNAIEIIRAAIENNQSLLYVWAL